MELELRVEFPLELVAAEEGAEPEADFGEEAVEHGALLRHVEDEADGVGEPGPGFGFGGELFPAGGGQLVELGLAVVIGAAPFGADPAAAFEAVQGGVEGALGDLEGGPGDVVEPFRDGP